MPRLGGRKRKEQLMERLGKPERLADIIVQTPPDKWKLPAGAEILPGMQPMVQESIRGMQRDIASMPVLVADNVAEFFYLNEKQDWHYAEDFPNTSPLFDRFFVEIAGPDRVLTRDGWVDCPQLRGYRAGVLFRFSDASAIPPQPPGMRGQSGKPIDLSGFSKAKWLGNAVHFASMGDRPTWVGVTHVFGVDERGQFVVDPFAAGSGGCQYSDFTRIAHGLGELLTPALLAISFSHCKNVELVACDPPPEVNRDRQAAGLKPFLRYNVIQIEPMKRVLHTEGNVESNGLKKALHICRSHFRTFTEDKPMFGRPGAHGTFLVPAHVRGSSDNGVVVSDYKVSPPATA